MGNYQRKTKLLFFQSRLKISSNSTWTEKQLTRTHDRVNSQTTVLIMLLECQITIDQKIPNKLNSKSYITNW